MQNVESYEKLKRTPPAAREAKRYQQERAYEEALRREIDNYYSHDYEMQKLYNEAVIRNAALGYGSTQNVRSVFEDEMRRRYKGDRDLVKRIIERFEKNAPNLSGFHADPYSILPSSRERQYQKNIADAKQIARINEMTSDELINEYKSELSTAMNTGSVPDSKILHALDARRAKIKANHKGITSYDYQRLSFDLETPYSKNERKRNKQLQEDIEVIEFSEENPGLYYGKGRTTEANRREIIDKNIRHTQEGTKLHNMLAREKQFLDSSRKNKVEEME